jgi:hypothetical protein
MTYFLSFCLLVIPWLIIPIPDIANQTRAIKEAFFDITCFGIIVFALIYGVKTVYKNKWLGILAGYLFITSFLFNWYMPQLMSYHKQVYYNLWAINPMIHVTLAIVATYFACATLTEDNFKTIGSCLAVSGILVALCMIGQQLGLDPFGSRVQYTSTTNHAVAILDNPDLSGGYLALILPFVMWKNKFWYWVGFGCCLVGIYFTGAKSGLTLCFVSIFVYLFLMFRKVKYVRVGFIGIILSGAVYTLLFLNGQKLFLADGLNGRVPIYLEAWKHIRANPLFGNGLGIWKTYQMILYQYLVLEVHSDWIERCVEIGLIGLFLMFKVLYGSFKNFNYKSEGTIGYAYFSSLVTFLIMMSWGFPMEIGALALTGLVCWWGVEKL